MTDKSAREKLERLLREAVKHEMTPEERRAQRISWAYGQMMDCAPQITKEHIAEVHDALYSASNPKGEGSENR